MDTVDHDHRLTFGLMESSPTLQWIPPFERTSSLTFFQFQKKNRNVENDDVDRRDFRD